MIYALVFDINGQISKIGWTMYPSQRIPNLVKEQAADTKEIWLADVAMTISDPVSNDDEMQLRRLCRKLHVALTGDRVRNEFFRSPMRMVDVAFGKVVELDAEVFCS